MTAAARADQVALRTLRDQATITFGEYSERVRMLAGGLHALGVGRGATVGLMLANRPEFHLLDTAAMHLGAAPFSIYNTSSPEQIAFVLGDARCAVVAVQAAFADTMREAIEQTPTVEHLILLDAELDGALTLEQVQSGSTEGFDFDAAWRAVTPDDLVTLIYTSGTTGPPKGVQLTHANELAQFRALDAAAPQWRASGGSVISYLPTAHIADRALSHYEQMISGVTVTTCPDPTQVFAHTIDARPTRFGGVPRVWEKLKAALEASIAAEPDEKKRAATRAAIDLGLRKVRAEQAGEPVPAELAQAWARADAAVFSTIRARLGFDRCESYVIGAAPAPLELFEFFAAIGIPICEVWGMSEISCVGTLVPPDGLRFGTVGKALPGVELKLADDGELLVRGPTVMAGYRNQPAMTAEAVDGDGWLHTGDVCSLDLDGYLRIIDRKDEIFKTSGGKFISPARVETAVMRSPFIAQAMVFGSGMAHPAALISPNWTALCSRMEIPPGTPPAELAARDDVRRFVAAECTRKTADLAAFEQIRWAGVLARDLTIEDGELTPTLKLKRRVIEARYASLVDMST